MLESRAMRAFAFSVNLVLGCALLLAGLGCAVPGAAAQKEPPVPKELLERVAAWAENFLNSPVSYAAEETLQQTHYGRRGTAGGRRLIVADYFYVRSRTNPRETAELRDLLAVDGKPAQTTAEREAKWARIAAARSAAEIAALLTDPVKQRLSPERFAGLRRLAGRFAERNWERMKYFFAQDTSDPPSRHVLVGYRQVAGEGLMVVDDRPVAPRGQAWIEPDDGHIARIEEEFQLKDEAYYIAVEFGRPEELGAWAPTAVTVRVFEKGRMVLDNQYSYTNFRRLPLD